MAGRKIVAVTGIGNPEPFYRIIHEWEGEIVDVLEFADHHRYSSQDWQQINRAARNADLIITTEKDILKLIRFPFGREKLLALRVTMAIENGDTSHSGNRRSHSKEGQKQLECWIHGAVVLGYSRAALIIDDRQF